METFRNKTAAITIAILLTLSMSASIMIIPNANAHSPPWTITDEAYVAVAPDPVGVGQRVEISMWTAQTLPNALLTNNIYKDNYTLVITAPNGTVTTQNWPLVDNPTGAISTSFVPTSNGIYTATFTYGGQTYPTLAQVVSTVPLPAATITSINALAGDIYTASTASCSFTVTQQPIPAPIYSYPLPTSYWTHPIEGQNTYWYTISSNWLGPQNSEYYFGNYQISGYNLYQPEGTGPNTGHIMWTQPIEFGGVVGGIKTGTPGMYYYSGSSYQGRFSSAIVMNGYLYFKMPLGDATTGGGTGNVLTNTNSPYVCEDLRTGKIIWQNNTINPTWGELLYFSNPNQNGVIPSGFLWQSVPVGTTTTWMAFSGWTGVWEFNITNVPSGTVVYDSNGNLDIYQLSYNTTAKTGWLALWNLTNVIANGLLQSQGVSIDMGAAFRPVENSVFNGSVSTAYSWNVTINANLDGLTVSPTTATGVTLAGPSIFAILPGDIIFGGSGLTSAGQYTQNPFTMWTINLNPDKGSVGQVLWVNNYTAPNVMTGNSNLGAFTLHNGPVDPTNRVITIGVDETFQWYGYSLDTGNLLWGPTNINWQYDYQYFGGGGGPGQEAVDAYGNMYIQGYAGVITCLNTEKGQVLWTFGNGGEGNTTNDGLNSPWGLLPIFISAVCDGKVYAFTSQHGNGAFGQYKGEMIYCLNATTGSLIWQMMGEAGQNAGAGTSTTILADGFLVYYNEYQNSLVSVGMGPSRTTVTAPHLGVTTATPVTITGTVMDISAGTKQDQQAADFPNGVPCVSDASMSDWMQYVYMQKPMPTNVTGVPVSFYVLDSNGNYRPIGTATTDTSGTYAFTWTPNIPGSFTIFATFAGSQSYWGSSDETALYATAAQTVTPTTTPNTSGLVTTADLITYILVATIAIIIAIAIATVLLLRKHP